MTGRPAPTQVEVRAVAADDGEALRAFFGAVPDGDRTFFREDVLRPGVVEGWVGRPDQRRLVALVDGVVAGHAGVLRGAPLSEHVGELRLVVDPAWRRRGLGRLLAQRAVHEAADMGLTKLVVEVVAEQAPTVAMFEGIGFQIEGRLRGHVRSRAGDTHDLLVLAHHGVPGLAESIPVPDGAMGPDGS